MGAAEIPLQIGAEVGTSILGDMLQSSAISKQASSQIDQLELQKQEEQTAETARSIKRADNLKTVVSSNLALAASRGESGGSGSFKAIQNQSYNQFNEDENMDELNTMYKEQAIAEKEKSIREEAKAKQASGFIGTIGKIFEDL